MTELHLDADEWSVIRDALKAEQERATKAPHQAYHGYVTSILLKVEAALLPEPRRR